MTLGIGCRSGVALDALGLALRDLMAGAPGALLCVATITQRQQEPALCDFARRLGLPLRAFTAAELAAHEASLTHRSPRVHALTGCWGVAESAALAAAGPGSRLVMPRRRWPTLTMALAGVP